MKEPISVTACFDRRANTPSEPGDREATRHVRLTCSKARRQDEREDSSAMASERGQW